MIRSHKMVRHTQTNPQMCLTITWNIAFMKYAPPPPPPPPCRTLGQGVYEILKFLFFLVLNFRGGCLLRGVYFLGKVQFILCLSHFEMQDLKNSKIFAYSTLNIHIFKFNMDAWLHVDIDFNTKSKFSCSRFFSLQVGSQNQPNTC